ncbi:hypothetical protein H4S02_012903 [Coemansia sp. RSA 2611]|nr:hypothetical protein H4S02_012903 [Coemansia sp. RSA 2611]
MEGSSAQATGVHIDRVTQLQDSFDQVEQEREFAALNEENEKASRDLSEATKMAHALLKDISTTLRTIADNAGKKRMADN